MSGEALNRIYDNLKAGEVYGHVSYYRDDYPDKKLAGKEYFTTNLYYSKPFFRWTHYGSSANGATKRDLKWIIETIFDTTVEDFERRYVTRAAFTAQYGSN